MTPDQEVVIRPRKQPQSPSEESKSENDFIKILTYEYGNFKSAHKKFETSKMREIGFLQGWKDNEEK